MSTIVRSVDVYRRVLADNGINSDEEYAKSTNLLINKCSMKLAHKIREIMLEKYKAEVLYISRDSRKTMIRFTDPKYETMFLLKYSQS